MTRAPAKTERPGWGLPPLEMRMSPRDAFFSEREAVPFDRAAGRVSAETLSPYPPVRGERGSAACVPRNVAI